MIAQPGKRDELVEILLAAASQVKHDAGCELYVVNKVDDEPDAVWVTEIWNSEAAHQASLQNPETKALIQRGRPLIAGIENPIRLRPVGGAGIT
jgi:quinol monooxygenase YgiN